VKVNGAFLSAGRQASGRHLQVGGGSTEGSDPARAFAFASAIRARTNAFAASRAVIGKAAGGERIIARSQGGGHRNAIGNPVAHSSIALLTAQ
jgi:hypothetical protein